MLNESYLIMSFSFQLLTLTIYMPKLRCPTSTSTVPLTNWFKTIRPVKSVMVSVDVSVPTLMVK